MCFSGRRGLRERALGGREGVEQHSSVSARMRCAIRTASPAGVRARWRSSRIYSFRLEKTLSITSAGGSERPLTADVGGRWALVRCEQGRAAGGQPRGVVSAPEALVADHDLGRGAGEQVGERLVL